MRRFLALLSTVVITTLWAVAPASAVNGMTVDGHASARPVEYLALGDSLAFGYSPLADRTAATNFVGYPDFVAASLRDILTNAACPGETSSHFIDTTGPDRGCGAWRAVFPLHTTYTGTQLAFADSFLADHPRTQLVTIDIGANDVSNLRDACLSATDVAGCVLAGLPRVLATISADLDTIYGHLRSDGYHHKLVALTIYSTDYADRLFTEVVMALDQVVAARTVAWGGLVADGFGAWAVAALPYGGDTCAAGLRVVTSTSPLTCDEHPSAAGHRLLAAAIVRALRAD